MFTFLSRFRRQAAVLTALALVASVLVAVPVSAADDPPKPSYEATFTACLDIPDADFTDVADSHANADDIDCIAYYGITQGTSATTYSPLMSVTREQMALFLIRLAGRVGIEMVSNPDDAGFTDIGDLSDESQTAINQLADLDITMGNNASGTTYGPSDPVTRGHMALFVARLMDKMTPMTDGDDDDGDWGYTPADVEENKAVDENDSDAHIGSPFTDLDRVTKETYDAITNLYELGVASGASGHATAYGPTQQMTRASMAGFMAGVLDHSNARPEGVSVQASGSGFDPVRATVIISVRDSEFSPVADQAVDHFNSELANGGLVRGKCHEDVADGCEWNEDDEFTAADGNLVLPPVDVTRGKTRVYYAWIGEDNGDKFDAAEVDYGSVSIVSMNDEEALKATSTINEEAESANGHQVDLDKVDSVTITVQLVDTAANGGPADDAKPVARSGQEITVGVTQTTDSNGDGDISGVTAGFSSTNVATLITDADGKATYTVEAPSDDNDRNDVQIGDDTDPNTDGVQPAGPSNVANLEDRIDVITFNYASGNDGAPTASSVTYTIRWSEANPVTTKAEASTNSYVIVESDGDARVSATVTFFDQYGNGYRQASGQKVGIEFNEETDSNNNAINPVANVNGNGVARRGKTLERQTAGTTISANYTVEVTEDANSDGTDDIDIPSDVEDDLSAGTIQVVTRADTDSTDAGSQNVHTLYADDNEFTTEVGGTESNAANADKLYSYDSDDMFIMSGESISMDKFEELLANRTGADNAHVNDAIVDVIRYNPSPNGESIFVVTQDSDPTN